MTCNCDYPEVHNNIAEFDGCDKWYQLCCFEVESPTLIQKWFYKKWKPNSIISLHHVIYQINLHYYYSFQNYYWLSQA